MEEKFSLRTKDVEGNKLVEGNSEDQITRVAGRITKEMRTIHQLTVGSKEWIIMMEYLDKLQKEQILLLEQTNGSGAASFGKTYNNLDILIHFFFFRLLTLANIFRLSGIQRNSTSGT